jgi:hypothetical protein
MSQTFDEFMFFTSRIQNHDLWNSDRVTVCLYVRLLVAGRTDGLYSCSLLTIYTVNMNIPSPRTVAPRHQMTIIS